MTEQIDLIEIDLERCSNTYGQAPCAASIPATGEIKCFNCWATCQDKNNFASETVVARYSTASAKLPASIDAIPNINSISLRPAKLELGESIGIRASIDISFADSRYPDTGPEGDRYLIDRDYDPYTRGTYWGKFRARWPFVQNSNIRLIRGTTDQSIAQMETRHFIIDSVAGPSTSGTFSIKCKDALQLADGKKAQAPLISNGELSAAIVSTDTSLTLSPAGIGNLEYPASGIAQIGGEEVVSFTRSGDVMTITRGQFNTTAKDHDASARVQLCLQYSAQTVTSILNDLLINYTGVPASFIPLADWTDEDSTYIGRNYSALIAEPTEVKKLINELLEQTASTVWWDDINKLLKFRVLRAVDSDSALYDDNLIKVGSFSSKDQPGKRVSQVWTYYGQINPLEKLDDQKNYATAFATVSAESEQNFNGVPSIKRIYSRWILDTGRDAAERLNNLILSRYTTPPRLITFDLQKDQNLITPSLGGGFRVKSWTIQDETGASVEVPVQVIQSKSAKGQYSVLAEEVLYSETIAPEDPTIKKVTIDVDKQNPNLRDLFNQDWTFLNPGDTAIFTIETGVEVGSTATNRPAFDFGSWPNDVTVKIVNRGLIAGKGGMGGAGGSISRSGESISTPPPGAGGNGGDAVDFNTMTGIPAVIIDNYGVIGSGGGGGGGSIGVWDSDEDPFEAYVISGSGGGGGAGLSSSAGGVAGAVIGTFSPQDEVLIGNAGQSSSATVPGNGGLGRISSIAPSLNTASGGTGGALGQSGNQPLGGGAGGAAGDAINKRGLTVTINNTGTIAGAIVN